MHPYCVAACAQWLILSPAQCLSATADSDLLVAAAPPPKVGPEPLRFCTVRDACGVLLHDGKATELQHWECLGRQLFRPVTGDPTAEYFVRFRVCVWWRSRVQWNGGGT